MSPEIPTDAGGAPPPDWNRWNASAFGRIASVVRPRESVFG
ncbi:hypothetical protein MIPYR_60068 [uncultured Microbacterium sp.]|uniref:Uncharacterized protein n=1 Tax=uncultured Microbacterium sp. TaxID=191216 RepID=A0A1Y5P6L2_9MICO|nr:hypothetical protein MIPYR_60068 [uncultured Microbacterium sp.]